MEAFQLYHKVDSGVFKQIVLSDGDPSTLANMKVNLELNGLCCLSSPTATSERTNECTQTVSAYY